MGPQVLDSYLENLKLLTCLVRRGLQSQASQAWLKSARQRVNTAFDGVLECRSGPALSLSRVLLTHPTRVKYNTESLSHHCRRREREKKKRLSHDGLTFLICFGMPSQRSGTVTRRSLQVLLSRPADSCDPSRPAGGPPKHPGSRVIRPIPSTCTAAVRAGCKTGGAHRPRRRA